VTGLDQHRVVSVYSPGSDTGGSGYIVKPGVVVTAAHVVGPVGSGVEVSRLERSDHGYSLGSAAKFVVHALDPEGSVDIALLTADGEPPSSWQHEPADPSDWSLPRLGRPIGDLELPAEAMGFPALQDRDRRLNTELARGTIEPRSRKLTEDGVRSYEFQVRSGTPAVHVSEQSLWAGASGSALFSGEHLIGILTEDEAKVTGRLEAVAIRCLLDAARFPTVGSRLSPTDHDRLNVEPVWAGGDILQSAFEQLPRDWSAADLLQPRYRVVPLDDGALPPEVAEIIDWCCEGANGTLVKLLTGGAAAGKTRLARESCWELRRRGWVTGILAPDARDMEALRYLRAEHQLIVVDDADLRSGQIDALLKSCASEPGAGRTRILAVARTEGSWWRAIRRRYDEAVDEKVLVVRPSTPNERVKTYRRALTAFQREHRLKDEWLKNRTVTGRAVQRAEAVDPVETGDLAKVAGAAETSFADDDFASYLLVLVQALADIRRHRQLDPAAVLWPGQPVDAGRTAELLDFVLDLERTDWVESAGAAGVPDDPTLLERVVAVASLAFAGGVSDGDGETEAASRLRLVPDLADERQLVLRRIARWQHERDVGPGYLQPLRPQRLAEHLIARVVRDFPDLPVRLLHMNSRGPEIPLRAEDKARQGVNTLRLLTDAVAAEGLTYVSMRDTEWAYIDPGAEPGRVGAGAPGRPVVEILDKALLLHSAALVRLAHDVGDNPASPTDTTGKALATALEVAFQHVRIELRHIPLDEAAAVAVRQITDDCPDFLLGVAVCIAKRAARHYHNQPRLPENRAAEGDALKRLSHYLADSGQRQEALTYAWDAVEHFRSLVRNPAAPDHRHQLAHSLANLSVRQYEVGRADGAFGAAKESVDLYEKLSRHMPDRSHHVFLANGLCNLSNSAAYLGQWQEALQSAQLAHDLMEESSLPPSSAADPADPTEQPAAVDEDVILAAQQVRNEPTAVAAARAHAARTLARRLASAGDEDRRQQAVGMAKNACERYAVLAADEPRRWQRDYAAALNVLGRREADIGEWKLSIDAHTSALQVFNGLEEEYREAVRPQHVDGLRDLADAYLGKVKACLEIKTYGAPFQLVDKLRARPGGSDDTVWSDLLAGALRIHESLGQHDKMSSEDIWARRQRRAHALRLQAELAMFVAKYLEIHPHADATKAPVVDAVRTAAAAAELYAEVDDRTGQGRRKLAWAQVTEADALMLRRGPGDDEEARVRLQDALQSLNKLANEEPGRLVRQIAGVKERIDGAVDAVP